MSKETARSREIVGYVSPPLKIGLSAPEAATFIGIGETFFKKLVADGTMPRPRVLGSRKLWHVGELAAAFNALPLEGEPQGNSWDDLED